MLPDPFILEGRLTGEACLRFLQEELPQILEDVPLNKRGRMYFQHHGAPPHSSREVRNFLNYRFPGRWIGRGGPHNWPARSPDLSPLDYCVWGWISGSCNEQLAQFTTECQPVLRPAIAFLKTSFKHRSVQINGNFHKDNFTFIL